MSDTIVLALGTPSLLSTSTTPPVRVNLPLTPATALQKALLTHLHALDVTRIIVAEPPISFPPHARACIKHAATRRGAGVRFVHPFRCVNAVLPCVLVLDVTRGRQCIVYDGCHVDLAHDIDGVVRRIQGFVARYDRFTKADMRIAVVGEREGFAREVSERWRGSGHGTRLRFVKCVFDNAVLVWVGAAVLAGCADHGKGDDGDEIG